MVKNNTSTGRNVIETLTLLKINQLIMSITTPSRGKFKNYTKHFLLVHVI